MNDLLLGLSADDLVHPIFGLVVATTVLVFLVGVFWRGRKRWFLAGSVVALTAAITAFALRPATVSSNEYSSILRIDGPIRPSTVADVHRWFGERPIHGVNIRSSWGISSTAAAREIQGVIRERNLPTTMVGPCGSACALVFFGGSEREMISGPASTSRLVLGSDVDWAPELHRVGAPDVFGRHARQRIARRGGFSELELIEANVVTHVSTGGWSAFCLAVPPQSALGTVSTAFPGSDTWLPRGFARDRADCGYRVGMRGDAGRFDLRIQLAGGQERVCANVVLRNFGDRVRFTGDQGGAALEIERSGSWIDDPDQSRRLTVPCNQAVPS